MREGGVVRSLENYGESQLAYRMRNAEEWFNQGRLVELKGFYGWYSAFGMDIDTGPCFFMAIRNVLNGCIMN